MSRSPGDVIALKVTIEDPPDYDGEYYVRTEDGKGIYLAESAVDAAEVVSKAKIDEPPKGTVVPYGLKSDPYGPRGWFIHVDGGWLYVKMTSDRSYPIRPWSQMDIFVEAKSWNGDWTS